MTQLSEPQIRVGIFLVGFVAGMGLSWWMWCRGKSIDREKLSVLQIGSILMFFGYMITSSLLKTPSSDLVLTAILGIFGGETFGKAVVQIRGGPDDKKKN